MAAAFHRAGHRVLSEDTTCVRPTEDDVGRSFAGVTDLAATIPVSRLRRPLDLGAIDDHLELVLAGV